MNGVELVENVHVIVQGLVVQVPDDEALSATVTSELLTSRKTKSGRTVEVAIALPLNVNASVRSIAEPALFAVKVMFAKLSTEDLTRPEETPRAVALGVSTVRRTVIVLPVALPVTFVVR